MPCAICRIGFRCRRSSFRSFLASLSAPPIFFCLSQSSLQLTLLNLLILDFLLYNEPTRRCIGQFFSYVVPALSASLLADSICLAPSLTRLQLPHFFFRVAPCVPASLRDSFLRATNHASVRAHLQWPLSCTRTVSNRAWSNPSSRIFSPTTAMPA